MLLAMDQADPARAGLYFEDNLLRLRRLGFKVEVFRPNAGTHEVTEEMKARCGTSNAIIPSQNNEKEDHECRRNWQGNKKILCHYFFRQESLALGCLALTE